MEPPVSASTESLRGISPLGLEPGDEAVNGAVSVRQTVPRSGYKRGSRSGTEASIPRDGSSEQSLEDSAGVCLEAPEAGVPEREAYSLRGVVVKARGENSAGRGSRKRSRVHTQWEGLVNMQVREKEPGKQEVKET